MTFELKPLSPADGRDIYDMLQEQPADENGYVNGCHGMTYDEFRAWLLREEANSRQHGIIDGWRVPQSTYWLYADGVPVGMGKLRHMLTDKLRQEGGHIGYAIRPSARGRGYGKALLRGLLCEARALGIDRALITVQLGNEPSLRVALSCGGKVERRTGERYLIWVPTGNP